MNWEKGAVGGRDQLAGGVKCRGARGNSPTRWLSFTGVTSAYCTLWARERSADVHSDMAFTDRIKR
jgi:hypothetical protein